MITNISTFGKPLSNAFGSISKSFHREFVMCDCNNFNGINVVFKKFISGKC